MNGSCLFCSVFSELFTLAFGTGNGGYARAAFDVLVRPANAFTRLVCTILVVWTMLQFMLYEDASREMLKRSIKLIAILVTVGFFSSVGGTNWLFEVVILGMQKTGLGIAQAVIGASGNVCGDAGTAPVLGDAGSGTYTALWQGVECVAFTPVRYAAENWARLSGISGFIGGLGDWFAWLILAFPYLFVLGIFGAFLIQSMFYFLALAGTTPVILIFVVFDSTRGICWAALKFLLSGALTVVFAGMAMGFTGFVLAKYTRNIANYQQLSISASLGQCTARKLEEYRRSHNGRIDNYDVYRVINNQCQAETNTASGSLATYDDDKVCDLNHFTCTKSYWAAFLIGMMSVLLHLLAPRIAANLSGASDSAATAAAVVGAGQMGAAKAMGWTQNTLGWGLNTAGRTGGLMLYGAGRAGGMIGNLAGALSGNAREMAAQERSIQQFQQLSIGIQNLTNAIKDTAIRGEK